MALKGIQEEASEEKHMHDSAWCLRIGKDPLETVLLLNHHSALFLLEMCLPNSFGYQNSGTVSIQNSTMEFWRVEREDIRLEHPTSPHPE